MPMERIHNSCFSQGRAACSLFRTPGCLRLPRLPETIKQLTAGKTQGSHFNTKYISGYTKRFRSHSAEW